MKQDNDHKLVKRVFKNYRYIENDAFAQYLHEMSLKGWHLKEWKFWLEFEKGECRDIEYAVEVFQKGSEMDVKPGLDAEEYAEYCRAAGWELVDGRRKFCIFRKISEDAIPIVTEEERFKNIRNAEWIRCLTSLLSTVFIFGLAGVQFFRAGSVLILFSNMLLILILTLAAVLVYETTQCIGMAVWCVKSGKKIRGGERLLYGKCWVRYILYGILILILIELTVIWGTEGGGNSMIVLWIWVGIVGAVLLGFFFYRPSRRENWVIQLLAGLGIGIIWCGGLAVSVTGGYGNGEDMLTAVGKLPLIMTDYRQVDEEITFADYKERSSVFGTVLNGAVEYGYPPEATYSKAGETSGEEWRRLSYTVYRTDILWLLEQVWQEEITAGNLEDHDWVIEAGSGYEKWGAKEVVHREWEDNFLYIRYEDAILTFYATEPPEGDQINIVREKLGL